MWGDVFFIGILVGAGIAMAAQWFVDWADRRSEK